MDRWGGAGLQVFAVSAHAAMCHNCGMNYLWRVRIDERQLDRADRVTERLGTTTQEMVRVLVARIAETGRVPLELRLEDDSVVSPWEQRAKTLESFYDPSKIW
jgi:antitoxin component of RelBE/YafQ-DinJ toxin-antitoxin module